jgi:recombination protein RecT
LPDNTETGVVKYNPNMPAETAGNLKSFLGSPNVIAAIAEVAPKFLTPERVVKMALIAANRQPKLLECTGQSILQAVMASAEVGLDCSGALGRAYLVPYKKQATFIMGYLGMLELAYRSDRVESIQAEVVYKQDYFNYEKGLKNTLDHIPSDDGDELDSDIIGAYTVCRFRGGGYHIHFMRRKQIDKIRREHSKTDKFWSAHYAAMCKKTVVRSACKFWPLSVETQTAIAHMDDEEYSAKVAPAVTLQPTNGRQSWGLAKQVSTEDVTDAEFIDNPDSIPAVSDQDRIDLQDRVTRRLSSHGKPTPDAIGEALKNLCDAYQWPSLESITSVDQLEVARQWIDEL